MKLEYHSHVPRNLRGNLICRQKILRACRHEPEYRRAVLQMCKDDPFFYINAFVWQANPNAVDSKFSRGSMSLNVGPFVTWHYQEEAFLEVIDCVKTRRDAVIEKSREMGASWLCLLAMEWLWRFHPMNSFILVSRNADAVDDYSMKSLMKKFDFVHEHLPDWLAPKRERRKMYLGNAENGSEITGEASTGQAGVGGRATAIFIDEFSQIKEDREVLNRTASTSSCRIFNGTHKGTGTAFFDLTNPSGTTKTFIKKIQMHWSKHPDKNKGMYYFDGPTQQIVCLDPEYEYPPDFEFVMDGTPTGGPYPGLRSPWYDDMCSRMDSAREVAMDLDIDAKGSVEQVFDTLMIRTLKARCVPPRWEGDVVIDDFGTPALRARSGGPLRLWCPLDHQGRPPRAVYAFGCDLSTGSGATNSCISGANAVSGEKIFEYANANIEATPLANLMVPVWNVLFCDEENGAPLVCWEIPGPGAMFGKRVVELGYRRVFMRKNEFSLLTTVSDVPGWNNTNESMLSIISEYKDALRSMTRFVNRSEAALEECLSFRYKPDGGVEHSGASNSKEYSGARVNHGDRVVADALCCKMVKQLNALADSARTVVAPAVTDQRTLAWRRARAAEEEREREQWA